MTISYKDRVAIVTGAGGGLGRAYALELAARGAKVVVNDLGGSRDGAGHSDAALKVVEEIKAAGGEAVSNGGSVTEYEQMVEMVAKTKEMWGGVHILINNAGILRDKSFAKMDMTDWKLVVDVHLNGSANCTKAVWDLMREQAFTKTLALEGAKYNVRVNTLAPVAGTRMTEDLGMPEALFNALSPENVAPMALYLVSEDAPTNMICGAGAGAYHAAYVTLTPGVALPAEDRTPEGIAAAWEQIIDRTGEIVPQSGGEQSAVVMAALAKIGGLG
jgi:NAD(P)-dependent dehydrogenase (short-subunit alcohol dehydrogenase family)